MRNGFDFGLGKIQNLDGVRRAGGGIVRMAKDRLRAAVPGDIILDQPARDRTLPFGQRIINPQVILRLCRRTPEV